MMRPLALRFRVDRPGQLTIRAIVMRGTRFVVLIRKRYTASRAGTRRIRLRIPAKLMHRTAPMVQVEADVRANDGSRGRTTLWVRVRS
jgi:hypothetical protein